MADALKILGEAYPAAATLADLYTVPASTQAVVRKVHACNQGTAAAKVRLSAAIAGAADEAKQYLAYDFVVPPGTVATLLEGFSMAATDVLRVRSDVGSVSFVANGLEVS